MPDLLSWSIGIGRWCGVPLRMHALLLLVCALVANAAVLPLDAWPAWYAITLLSTLLASLLLHEMGHLAMAVRVGGDAETIVLWPFGGLAFPQVPSQQRAEVATAIAGPVINALLAAAALFALFMSDRTSAELFNPLWLPSHGDAPTFSWQTCLQLVFWINWVLFLVNLLPAIPLDGGRVLRSVLWSAFDYRTSVLVSARAGQVAGVAACLAAWLSHDAQLGPVWAPLVLLGGALFFNAQGDLRRLRAQEEHPFGYRPANGDNARETAAALQPSDAGRVRRWLDERKEARLERQRQIEAEEESRMDDILARLHERGLDGLSVEDRAILDRVSARYRDRLKHMH